MENEILQYSYWEHFKWAKELSLVLPLDHPKRMRVEKELNIILDQIKSTSEIDNTKFKIKDIK